MARTIPHDAVIRVRREAREGAHSHRDTHGWVERSARVGYGAKGVVYALVGVIAAQAAFGDAGRATNSSGALTTILGAPLGRVILGIMAVGLLGYVIWRAACALFDPEHKGDDAKGIAQRLGYAGAAFAYGGLAWEAARLAINGFAAADSSGSNTTEHWTARLMDLPAGRWLVGIVGAGVIAYGLYQLYRAATWKVRNHLALGEVDEDRAEWIIRLGRVGIGARSVVFAVIGWLLIQAALRANANAAGGLGDALQTLERSSSGPWLLGAVAVGVIAYGAYEMVCARYRRVPAE